MKCKNCKPNCDAKDDADAIYYDKLARMYLHSNDYVMENDPTEGDSYPAIECMWCKCTTPQPAEKGSGSAPDKEA